MDSLVTAKKENEHLRLKIKNQKGILHRRIHPL